jgi:hypothetical protein
MDLLHDDPEIDAWMRSEMDRGLAEIKAQALESLESGGGAEYLIQTVSVRALYFESIVGGQTLARRWEEDAWKGWSNDERQLIGFTQRSLRLGVIEVQQVTGDHQVVCRDPSDPDRGEFVVFDRSLAGRAAPYDLLFGWVMDLPHFSRTIGSCLIFERRQLPELLGKLRELAAEAGGSDQYRSILASQAVDLWCWLYRKTTESKGNFIAGLDAHWCRAEFRIVGDADGPIDFLESQAQFELADPDESDEQEGEFLRLDWMRGGDDAQAPVTALQSKKLDPDGSVVGESLGRLIFVEKESHDELILECVTREMFEYLIGRAMAMFGSSIILQKRSEEDLSKRSPGGSAQPKVLPDPAESDQITASILQERYSALLHEPVPMIRNLTPLEAAASSDPEVRAELEEFARTHVNHLHELANRKGHTMPELAWFFEQIGMGDIWR